MKANKAADEKGFVAELIHFASDNFLNQLFRLFTGFMHSPQVPIDWRKTIFNMRRNNSLQNVPYMYSYDPWYEDACNLPKLCEGMAHVGAVIASSIITQYRVFWNGWSEIARHVINH